MKKVVLVILDGWGLAPAWGGNAIEMSETPLLDEIWRKYPHTALKAAEESVGLPRHENGNSEVGHLNIGSGQIVFQNLPGITTAINDGSFFSNEVLLGAFTQVKQNQSNLHLIGLVSDGGIHSHIDHLYALLEMAKKQQVQNAYIHMITDGRDTDPMKALSYLSELEDKIKEIGIGKVESVSGRYWAMDRDKHWDRIQKSYDILTQGIGPQSLSVQKAISENYRQNKTDEFILPTAINKPESPFVPIADNDSIIFFNFRAERTRELTESLVTHNFKGFDRKKKLQNIYFASFAYLDEYADGNLVKPVFHRHDINNPLAKVISDAGLKQLHIAETEKYAHVTFFFNGSREAPFPGEDRILVHSPKVATFDLKPEMAADDVADKVMGAIGKYDFIVCNFANADMVGHTGNIKAAIRACEKLDELIGKIVSRSIDKDVVLLITADHGNAEQMLNPNTGENYTEHTASPVPFMMISKDPNFQRPLRQAVGDQTLKLSDIAPTVLQIMDLQKPMEMTGESLIS
ncbi:MAG: 2,3-bisphosphoglycerate-independent phosphoglycerate mutase [Berkelbacteria bacterium GW2011_GWE1_39_12]|uniref:2,3-bisphosphoglycerate-independent phosphoglycerate mutase n=1 Tax=Berkelbacteria bacterium GW2011_GWE1_39_12 TaxID=1618337 RepID=A0A0G4B4M5_9BACT|nr:MAG: 2,3-bisphosphoglycerate-independent phosphoglycerate mutase [Berkelbacteria bacterium GW2011_GWE1_39_12]